MRNPAEARPLSQRERQILDLSARGLTDKAIAAELEISLGTLYTYWTRVRQKLNASSRAELAAAVTKLRASQHLEVQVAKNERLSREIQDHLEMERELEKKISQRSHELQEANEKLEESEARLHAIMAVALDGIVTIDETCRVETFNRAAENMFGYFDWEVVGRNVAMLMPEGHAARHDEYVANHLRTGESKIIGIGRQVTAKRKDGTTFPVWLELHKIQVNGRWLFSANLRPLMSDERIAEIGRSQSSAV